MNLPNLLTLSRLGLIAGLMVALTLGFFVVLVYLITYARMG